MDWNSKETVFNLVSSGSLAEALNGPCLSFHCTEKSSERYLNISTGLSRRMHLGFRYIHTSSVLYGLRVCKTYTTDFNICLRILHL